MVKFLHTSDWQLGMTRAYLTPEAQVRYTDDQILGIRSLAEVASAHDCQFVVVAGDVFDSIQPDRRMVSRTLDALESFKIPVYLLPGNHDADSPAALWSTSDILEKLPSLITLIRDSEPIRVPDTQAEIIGAPWPSRKPDEDLMAKAVARAGTPESGVYRVVVGHGIVDSLAPDQSDLAVISLSEMQSAIQDGRASYIALGDRHSYTRLGDSGAICYSGAPLATDFKEIDPNKALIVDLADGTLVVQPIEIGKWKFVTKNFDLSDQHGVLLIQEFLDSLANKDRTVVKLGIVGTLSLSIYSALSSVLDQASDLFASVDRSDSKSELVVLADDKDLSDLDLSGFAREAANELARVSSANSEQSAIAKDALLLLNRLVRRQK
ncbi:MAG: metallophosphoesterase family protein [Ferrimicrobium sp.]